MFSRYFLLMENIENLLSKKLFILYSLLLFYENCPVSMQTVFLVQNIFLSYLVICAVSPSNTKDDKIYTMSRDFVSNQLSLSLLQDSLLTEYFNGTKLLFLMKQYARSKAVKAYFDL